MIPTDFPEANCRFKAPTGLSETQVLTIAAYSAQLHRGSLDGSDVCVLAWVPTPEELEDIKAGKPIYVSMIGGVLPHYVCTNFQQAINCA